MIITQIFGICHTTYQHIYWLDLMITIRCMYTTHTHTYRVRHQHYERVLYTFSHQIHAHSLNESYTETRFLTLNDAVFVKRQQKFWILCDNCVCVFDFPERASDRMKEREDEDKRSSMFTYCYMFTIEKISIGSYNSFASISNMLLLHSMQLSYPYTWNCSMMTNYFIDMVRASGRPPYFSNQKGKNRSRKSKAGAHKLFYISYGVYTHTQMILTTGHVIWCY